MEKDQGAKSQAYCQTVSDVIILGRLVLNYDDRRSSVTAELGPVLFLTRPGTKVSTLDTPLTSNTCEHHLPITLVNP